MNETPLISVIVGVYNKEDFIGECLQSILAQTYRNFELIIVDDCSSDASVSEIQKYKDSRLRFLKMSRNSRCPAVPRNRGIEISKGKYIAFLDADDRWESTKLEKQVAFMQAYPRFRLTHTACWKIDGQGKRLGIRHEGSLPPSGDYIRCLLDRVWISISTIMLTRDLLEQIGGFAENMLWRGEEDSEFALRCAAVTPFGVLQEPLAEYRTGIDNISASKKWKSVGRDYVLYRHILQTPSLWADFVTRNEMTNIVLSMAEEGAFYWRARGEYYHALWFAYQMLLLSPFQIRGWNQLLAVGLLRR